MASKPTEVAIDATNFPDENFRNYLLQQSYGQDGVLTEEEISGVTSIHVSLKNISSLKGIEHFTALTYLDCYENQLTALDVSKNTALTWLSCNSNQLTALDVSKNTALTHLECSYNRLTALDVSKNTALTWLECSNNQLTALDVSKNTALERLFCSKNQLTALDVSNTALTSLQCYSNQLTALDVSKNTALTDLACFENQLTTLDVSKNTALKYLYCSDNQLTALDVSKNTALKYLSCFNNQLTSLDVSKNTALTELLCYNNQLTALDVSKNTALKYLYCYSNQLTSLDVSKNTALTDLACYSNRISVSSMDDLINSLPMYETENTGRILVINISDPNEGNVCTKSQVAAIKAKGWTPKSYDGSYTAEYEGSEEDPLVFAAESANGVPMTFKITDEEAKTCQIGDGVNPAISTGQTGKVVLPITANGYSVTAIATNAFKGTGIGTVYIPNTIRAIGDGAFMNCQYLDDVKSYFEEPFDIPSNVFSGISSSATLEIVYGTKDKYLAATGWNKFAEYDESMYFIDGIRYSVEGANPVEVNGNPYTAWVKESYWNLYTGDVVIPETFAIGDETFTVVGIDDNAFDGSAIRSVIIPKSVRGIEDGAFADCQQLQTVKSYIIEPKDESSAFLNIPSSATLYVPAGTKALYESLGGWNLFTNIVEMEEEVEPTDISQMDNVIYVVEEYEGVRGGRMNLSVRIKNSSVTAEGFDFDLSLPEGFNVAYTPEGNLDVELSGNRTDETKTELREPDLSADGRHLHVTASPTNTSAYISGSDGEVLKVGVMVDENVAVGSYAVLINDGEIHDREATYPHVERVACAIHVCDKELGNANGNEYFNGADYTSILHYLWNRPDPTFVKAAADVNRDGAITVSDQTAWIRLYQSKKGNVQNVPAIKMPQVRIPE